MNLHSSKSWIREHWIFSVLATLFIPVLLVTLYVFICISVFGYELGGTEAVKKLAEKAVATGDPAWCSRMIYPNITMGPAKYEFVNNCLNVYAKETGDISVCMNTMSPDSCVLRIAESRNEPELCAQAIDPRRQGTDGRGKCFGYFAKRERNYEYCTRLETIEDMSNHQKIICMMLYVDSTGDATHCPVHDEPDICYNKAAQISNDSSLCSAIKNDEKKNSCITEATNKE